MAREFKLGIGLPLTNDLVYSQFLDSWTLMKKPDFIYHRPQWVASSTNPIDEVRNDLVEQALHSGVTHLLQLDTDQVYPQDLIPRLLSHKLPIVAAKVHRRYPPFDPVMYRDKSKTFEIRNRSKDDLEIVCDEEWKSGELVEVDATGSACILIDTDVFLDIEYPWYERVKKEKGGSGMGEDIVFCYKARKANYQIFVDTSLKVEHLGLFEFNEATYDIFKTLNSRRKKNGGESRT